MTIAKVSAGRGPAWIGKASNLVTSRPAAWMGGAAALLGLAFILGFIPLLGGLLTQALQLIATIMGLNLARSQMRGSDVDWDAVGQLTRKRLGRLILMSIVSFLLLIVCALPLLGTLAVAGGLDFVMQSQSKLPELTLASTLIVAFGGLITAVASAVAFTATAFTWPLILFQDQSISNALRLSLQAVWLNIGALLVFGLLMGCLLLICALPFGLGLIFGLPTALASYYVIYEELFGQTTSL